MTLLAIGISASLAGSALADNAVKADKAAKADKVTTGTKPAKMTCQDFIELDEVARPKLVYWAEGVNRKGKPEDAVFDVEMTDRLVPVLVEVCKKEPKESFWKKAKVEFKKIF
jgi:acid stress chaperone HdeA